VDKQLELDLFPSSQTELFGFDYMATETLRIYTPILMEDFWERARIQERFMDLLCGQTSTS
jgi:hypothetical protein